MQEGKKAPCFSSSCTWTTWSVVPACSFLLHIHFILEKVSTLLMLTIALLLLLSRFSRVRLCATPQTAAHQAPPSLGFSRQEHWSGLPFPSQMHEGEKWKWSRSVVSDSSRPRGLQPTRLLHPWNSSAQIAPGFRVCLLTFFLTTGFFYDGLPWWLRGRESTCRCRRCRLDSWVGKILWRRKW